MSKHDIKFPIRYDKESGFFFDDKNNMIAEIRGWGRIQYLDNPEETQDANAQFIVTACNYHDRLVESLSDLLADPDKYTVLEKTDLMIKAGNILKELEESCKEK